MKEGSNLVMLNDVPAAPKEQPSKPIWSRGLFRMDLKDCLLYLIMSEGDIQVSKLTSRKI